MSLVAVKPYFEIAKKRFDLEPCSAFQILQPVLRKRVVIPAPTRAPTGWESFKGWGQVPTAWTKEYLFSQLHKKSTLLARDRVEFEAFLGEICKGCYHPSSFSLPSRPQVAGNVLLAEKGVDVIRATIEAKLQEAADELATHFCAALALMVQNPLPAVGVIRWSAEDPTVCAYAYPLYFRSQKSIDLARTRTVTQTLDVAVHVHELIGAGEHAISSAKPYRLTSLFKNIPEALAPVLREVSGQQISELVVERRISETTWSEPLPVPQYQKDPALVLGQFVLAGWSAEEK